MWRSVTHYLPQLIVPKGKKTPAWPLLPSRKLPPRIPQVARFLALPPEKTQAPSRPGCSQTGQQREWRGPVSKLRAWAGRGRLLPSPTAPLAGNTPRPEGDLQSADLIPVSHTLTSNSTLEKHPSDRLPEIGAGMDGARWENGERRL